MVTICIQCNFLFSFELSPNYLGVGHLNFLNIHLTRSFDIFKKKLNNIICKYILTDLTVGSGFTERTPTCLFASAVECARSIAALSHARCRWSRGSGGLCVYVFDEPNAVLRIHFVRIDERKSDVSFELFDLVRNRIVFYLRKTYTYNII